MFIETCEKCGKKYKMEEIHVCPWGKDNVRMICPYCGNFEEKMSVGRFRITKLTIEEERDH